MERVLYKNNPLIEVIIQVKFPKILLLNKDDPIEFQEMIKKDFPIYQLTIEHEQELSININSETALPTIVNNNSIKNHNFISADGKYKINLTSGFISISTVDYTRWEEFFRKFIGVLEKFEKIYMPPFYERIGLRYIDAFSRKKLNIEEKSWKDLISSTWLGAFAFVTEEDVINTGIDVEYQLSDKISRAKIHAGLGNINNDTENVFIVDSDFIHINNTNTTDSKKILEYLHGNAKDFIHSVIKEELHLAMQPEKI